MNRSKQISKVVYTGSVAVRRSYEVGDLVFVGCYKVTRIVLNVDNYDIYVKRNSDKKVFKFEVLSVRLWKAVECE